MDDIIKEELEIYIEDLEDEINRHATSIMKLEQLLIQAKNELEEMN